MGIAYEATVRLFFAAVVLVLHQQAELMVLCSLFRLPFPPHEELLILRCSIAMGCLFVDREKGDGGKQINKEVTKPLVLYFLICSLPILFSFLSFSIALLCALPCPSDSSLQLDCHASHPVPVDIVLESQSTLVLLHRVQNPAAVHGQPVLWVWCACSSWAWVRG